MAVVAFGSGSCSTIEVLIRHQDDCEHKYKRELFRVASLVTDKASSRAHEIAEREGIPCVFNDFGEFMRSRGIDTSDKKQMKDPEARTAYDQKTLDMLMETAEAQHFRVDLVALAGYMLKMYAPMVSAFSGRMINSHPARLALLDERGRRKYRGDNAVFDAIWAGEESTCTSIHVVREGVDSGEILVTSAPLSVDLPAVERLKVISRNLPPLSKIIALKGHYDQKGVAKDVRDESTEALAKLLVMQFVADPHQRLQKYVCDYPAYDFVLEEIANGNFALDDCGAGPCTVWYNGEKMPYGGVQL
jgi:phosphoribosylglycinamide formyltransferase-1